MRTIYILVRKDFAHFFRNKAGLALTFLVPFTLIFFFGQIWGVNRQNPGTISIPLAVINKSDSPAALTLVTALEQEKSFRLTTNFTNPDRSTRPLSEAEARSLMQATDPDFRFALVIPDDAFSPNRLALRLKVLSNPRNELETQAVNGLLQKTLFLTVPELLAQSLQERAKARVGAPPIEALDLALADNLARSFGGDREQILQSLGYRPSAPDPVAQHPASQPTDFFSRLVRIDREQIVGANVKNPAATSVVGGWAMQFLLFVVSVGASGFFREGDSGLFHRLLAAPVTRAQILWSKFVFCTAIGLLQLVSLFLAGRLLFGIEVEKHLGLLVLVCIFAAGACASFGMLLAAISPNAEAAYGLATFLILMMSAFGGAWFPVSWMPPGIQPFAKLSLVYWALEGFSAVLWAGKSFTEILPILGILGGLTAVVMTFAIWRFNRGQLFD